MIIARVVGAAVASLKLDALKASKLLVVRQTDAQGEAGGPAFLAIDLVGAGEGELVMVSQGSSARKAIGNDRSPADAAIIGILDSVQVDGAQVFTKQ
jgi:ethanolamine utilization protein EutN